MATRKKKIHTTVLDFDDSCVSFIGHLCHIHNAIHGSCIHANDITEWDITSVDTKDARGNRVLGSELLQTFEEYEQHGLYAQLPLLPYADHAIKLMKKLGYKVVIMTARKPEFEQQTRLNIILHSLPIDMIVFTDDKVKEIKKLQKEHNIALFADDKLSTVESVNEQCRVNHNFLIDMKHNQTDELDENIKRISNLFESVRFLRDVS